MNIQSISNLAPKKNARILGTTTLLLSLAIQGFGVSLSTTRIEREQASAQKTLPCYRDGVRHLAGLPDLRQGIIGKLWIDGESIGFENQGATTWIHSSQILKISVGDEWFLRGGAFGRSIRTGSSVGGSLAIALTGASQVFSVLPLAAVLAESIATQAHENILIVEFLDAHEAYHAATFALPGNHGKDALMRLMPPAKASMKESPLLNPSQENNCAALTGSPTSLTLLPLQFEDTELPAEYRALVYEQVFRKLQENLPQLSVSRFGSESPAHDCGVWHLSLTANSFHKGDGALRAFTGPIGFFSNTTSLQYQMEVTNSVGDSILRTQMKSVVRGDRDSLDLTRMIAVSVTRKCKQLVEKTDRTI